MNKVKNLIYFFCKFLFVFFASVENAYAYLDPGTSGAFLSMVLGLFVAGWTFLKIKWNKLKLFIQNIFKKKNKL